MDATSVTSIGPPTDDMEKLAWMHAQPYVQMFLTAARLQGIPTRLETVKVGETFREVHAKWFIGTARPRFRFGRVWLETDGTLEVTEFIPHPSGTAGQRHHRFRITYSNWPWVVENLLTPL